MLQLGEVEKRTGDVEGMPGIIERLNGGILNTIVVVLLLVLVLLNVLLG